MAEALELILKIKTEGQGEMRKLSVSVGEAGAATKSTSVGLRQMDAAMGASARSARELSGGLDSASSSMAGQLVKGVALTAVIVKAGQALKQATVDSALYAARTETLAITNEQLARSNNLNVDSLHALVERIKALGISTQEARNTVNQMIFAQLDLAKATDLARLAQDTAVIADENSSQTLEKIILGITTGMTRLLHTLGLQISAEREWVLARRKLGREMTEQERRQAIFDAVLREGTKIFGAYEAAMDTAGKRLTSLQRHIDEARNALGAHFLPLVAKAVDTTEAMAKHVQRNSELYADLAKAVGLATGALVLYRTTAALAMAIETGAVASRVGRLLAVTPAGALAGGAAVLGGGALLATLDQLEELEQRYKALFATSKDADELRAAFAGVIAKIQEGKAGAAEFQKVLQDALRPPERERIKGIDEKIALDFKKHNLRAFIADQLKLDPEQVRSVIDSGSQVGRALAFAIQAAFKNRFRLFKAEDFGLDLVRHKTDAELEAEREAFAKERERAEVRLAALLNSLRPQPDTAIGRFDQTVFDALKEFEKFPDMARKIAERAGETRRKMVEELIGPGVHTDLSGLFRSFGISSLRPPKGTVVAKAEEAAKEAVEDAQKARLDALERSNRSFEDSLKRTIELEEVLALKTKETTDQIDRATEAARERNLEHAKAVEDFQRRVIEITSGPGGELSAAVRVRDLRLKAVEAETNLRLDAADKLIDAEKRRTAIQEARDQASADRQQARFDFELRLLELQRKQLDEYREAAGRIFDALLSSGRTGLTDFFSGQLRIIQRQIFVNLAAELFKVVGPILGGVFHGQKDKQGNLTLLGRILQGTIFGVGQADLAAAIKSTAQATAQSVAGVHSNTATVGENTVSTASNTAATSSNTQALHANTAALGRLLATQQQQQIVDILGGGDGGKGTGGFINRAFPGTGQKLTGRQIATTIGVGAGLAAMNYFTGPRGVKGTLSAGGDLLMAVAPLTGAAAPFVMAAGASAKFLSAVVADPKRTRNTQVDAAIEVARRARDYFIPAPIEALFDARTGREVDQDIIGRYRQLPFRTFAERPPFFSGNPWLWAFGASALPSIPSSAPIPSRPGPSVTVNVNTMDARSFLDHRYEIAGAVRASLQDDYRLVAGLQSALLPTG